MFHSRATNLKQHVFFMLFPHTKARHLQFATLRGGEHVRLKDYSKHDEFFKKALEVL